MLVKIVDVGVLSIQGAISEHIDFLHHIFEKENIDGKIIKVRNKNHIEQIDALIIPGGESTTISKILVKSGINDSIKKRIKDGNFPIMGTCAGCVLLAKKIIDNKGEVTSLEIMDIDVERNKFGRQKESFEKNILIKGYSEPFHAIFIRAPIINRVWGDCEILATVDKRIVAVRQNNIFAYSFHPELSEDYRLHVDFLDMIL